MMGECGLWEDGVGEKGKKEEEEKNEEEAGWEKYEDGEDVGRSVFLRSEGNLMRTVTWVSNEFNK